MDMPSSLHEALVLLFCQNPRMALLLLERVLGITMPGSGTNSGTGSNRGNNSGDGVTVELTAAAFSELNPAEYRADVVLRVRGADGALRDLVIIEVQLDIDRDKSFSWPQYMTGARARARCPVTLAVIAVNERVARWCARPIELDRAGSVVRPVVIGPSAIPLVTDIEYAHRWPELAVLSAVAHGREPGAEGVGVAAYCASRALDNDRAPLYADLILANLGEAAREALEKYMQQHGYTYQSDVAKKYVAQGVEQGYRDLLRNLLEQRFGPLPADAVAKLDQADADTLLRWSQRMFTAGALSDVFIGGNGQ